MRDDLALVFVFLFLGRSSTCVHFRPFFFPRLSLFIPKDRLLRKA